MFPFSASLLLFSTLPLLIAGYTGEFNDIDCENRVKCIQTVHVASRAEASCEKMLEVNRHAASGELEGVSVGDIERWNPHVDCSKLEYGDTICIQARPLEEDETRACIRPIRRTPGFLDSLPDWDEVKEGIKEKAEKFWEKSKETAKKVGHVASEAAFIVAVGSNGGVLIDPTVKNQ
ncbi:hypothetical protein BJ508DRAFT_375821 [Ascobolus immersus RN42]|uniref:LysM domain-containing protein n=1 Tax=Ascobolus immersus RN42 TaxID=1160509 RepID=A0A3N4IA55_ASCIM|nr:hypothetical protein BJ508DRAFT_375821 [Ascobolus immersus RN42]